MGKSCDICGHSSDFHAVDGCFWRPNINIPSCACLKTSTHFKLEAVSAELTAARAEIERLNKALEFYANKNTYNGDYGDSGYLIILMDEGKIARAALEGGPK